MDYNFIRMLYFIVLYFLNWLSFRWIWNLALESAEVTKQELWAYMAKFHNPDTRSTYVPLWLIRQSPEPGKTKRLLNIYYVGIWPVILCAFFALEGFWTHIFDEILSYASIAIPLLISAATITNILYRKRNRGNLPDRKNLFTEQKEFLEFLKNQVRKERIEPYKKHHKGSTGKFLVMGFLKLAVAIGIMIGIFLLILNLANNP